MSENTFEWFREQLQRNRKESATLRLRVKATEEARNLFKRLDWPVYGWVEGFGRKNPEMIYVVRDGTHTRTAYHRDFWEPCDAD